MTIQERLKSHKPILFDGAMGTMLQRKGFLLIGEAPEPLNIKEPELLRGIHRAYIEAGADIITTNTFGAGAKKLAPLAALTTGLTENSPKD